MSNNLKMLALVVFGIIMLFIFNDQYKSHNLKKTVSACMLAQKKTSKSITPEEARIICEKQINKMVNNSK
jgi:hypothetical protein|tara:strand:- start:2002 stop:2211 length:210 start_codon:yes stop_codon:yes gene_type:complete